MSDHVPIWRQAIQDNTHPLHAITTQICKHHALPAAGQLRQEQHRRDMQE